MRHSWRGLLYVRNQTSPTPTMTMLYNVNILKRTAANSHEKVLNATNRPTCQQWSCFLILLVLTQTLDRYVASHKPCSACNCNDYTTRLCHTHLSAHIMTGQLREVMCWDRVPAAKPCVTSVYVTHHLYAPKDNHYHITAATHCLCICAAGSRG